MATAIAITHAGPNKRSLPALLISSSPARIVAGVEQAAETLDLWEISGDIATSAQGFGRRARWRCLTTTVLTLTIAGLAADSALARRQQSTLAPTLRWNRFHACRRRCSAAVLRFSLTVPLLVCGAIAIGRTLENPHRTGIEFRDRSLMPLL